MIFTTPPAVYFGSGYETMLSWIREAEKHDFDLRTARDILEFGCGTGRLIRHLRGIDGVRLAGTDVNQENIAWCQTHLSGIDFYLNEYVPPLEFAQANSFDLVFALSVFTQIPLETQAAWIEEIYRILKPSGYFLVDVLGRHHQEIMLPSSERIRLQKEGSVVLDSKNPLASYSTQKIGSWDVFQTHAEVLKAFEKKFRVLGCIPGKLDFLILQKPTADNISSLV